VTSTDSAHIDTSIEVTDLHLQYGSTAALAGIDLQLRPDRIIGLLGRNGAGKTTLLSILAGHRRATSGAVRIGGLDVWETERMRDVFLIGEGEAASDSGRLRDRARFVATLRPNFDRALFDTMLTMFELDSRTRVSKLSRGQRAAAGVALALASRSPITILDEAHIGMDAQNRYALWDLMLADYAAHPRTIIISTHHVDEVANVLEDVVILEAGTVLRHAIVDDLVGSAATITGPTSRVDELVEGMHVVADRSLGATREVTVTDVDTAALRTRAGSGVRIDTAGLQDLFVHLTTAARQGDAAAQTAPQEASA